MTTKEYLLQAFMLDKLIKSKETQLNALHETKRQISCISVPNAEASAFVENTTESIRLLTEEYTADIAALVRLKNDIKRVIDSVIEVQQKLILEERYINFKTWERIAMDNYYSWDTVHRYHRKALAQIEEQEVCIM